MHSAQKIETLRALVTRNIASHGNAPKALAREMCAVSKVHFFKPGTPPLSDPQAIEQIVRMLRRLKDGDSFAKSSHVIRGLDHYYIATEHQSYIEYLCAHGEEASVRTVRLSKFLPVTQERAATWSEQLATEYVGEIESCLALTGADLKFPEGPDDYNNFPFTMRLHVGCQRRPFIGHFAVGDFFDHIVYGEYTSTTDSILADVKSDPTTGILRVSFKTMPDIEKEQIIIQFSPVEPIQRIATL
jgi:hypothetical protein